MLEEAFTFEEKDDALTFAAVMKRSGCRTMIKRGCRCISEDELQISIGVLRGLRSRITSAESVPVRFDEMIERIETDINRFFGDARVGDLITEDDRSKEWFDQLSNLKEAYILGRKETDEEFRSNYMEAFQYLATKLLLINAGVLKNEPEGYRVIGEIITDRLFITVPEELYSVINTEEFKDLPYRSVIMSAAIPVWHVTTSPELYFSDVIDDLPEILEEFDISEEELEKTFRNIQVKEELIRRLTTTLREMGTTTLQELIARCSKTEEHEMIGETMEIERGSFDPIVITEIVDEMRKIHIIKGNPEKLRLA